MSLHEQIRHLANEFFSETVAARRHLHMHPELSFAEAQTAAYVQQQLRQWGIAAQTGFAEHGVVGLIEGTKAASVRTIALRADMDALPIHEANDVPYKSVCPGVMHACGHDVHTSSLLGTARILQHLRHEFAGTIKLVFQPAEEKAPGGASLMIRDGVLRNPAVERIFGQHVQPYLDCGKVGVRSGMYMASADEIYVTIKGKGGHGAHPGNLIDPVVIMAQILTALQQVVSRSDPRTPSVLSFGTVRAEGATNVVPDEVYLEGTFRTMNEDWRKEAHRRIRSIVEGIAASFGARAELEILVGYPVLYNDPALTARTRALLAEYAGEENIVDLDLWMAAEDFAFYTQEIPGCFYRLGTRNEARGIVHGLHTPRFDVDEDALRLSTGLMAWVAIHDVQAEAS
jgi:amidohydrolase